MTSLLSRRPVPAPTAGSSHGSLQLTPNRVTFRRPCHDGGRRTRRPRTWFAFPGLGGRAAPSERKQLGFAVIDLPRHLHGLLYASYRRIWRKVATRRLAMLTAEEVEQLAARVSGGSVSGGRGGLRGRIHRSRSGHGRVGPRPGGALRPPAEARRILFFQGLPVDTFIQTARPLAWDFQGDLGRAASVPAIDRWCPRAGSSGRGRRPRASYRIASARMFA